LSVQNASTTANPVTLRPTLGLWDLILYGVIVIQPTAPMSVFGAWKTGGFRRNLVDFEVPAKE
jgi:hypothetical protein